MEQKQLHVTNFHIFWIFWISLQVSAIYSENINKYVSFEDDRGKIIGDFQQFQEINWLNDLRSKHKVVMNKKAVKRLRKKYN